MPFDVQKLRRKLEHFVVGAPHWKSTWEMIAIDAAGFRPDAAPVAASLLVGPTGSGKTYTALSFAEALHDSPKSLVINCGEFQASHELAKLQGSPPGYLGHRETVPVITQAAFDSNLTPDVPYSVVVFDEIEKAHPDMMRYLLGALDSGVTRTALNTPVNWDRTLIFFTSNLGQRNQRLFNSPLAPSASPRASSWSQVYAEQAIRKHFTPEFLNRLTSIEYFQPFTIEEARTIFYIELAKAEASMRSKCDWLDPSELESIFLANYSPIYGAREIRRAIKQHILIPRALHLTRPTSKTA